MSGEISHLGYYQSRDSPAPNCLEDSRAPPPPHGVEPGAAGTVPTAAQPLPLAAHRAAAGCPRTRRSHPARFFNKHLLTL